MIKPARLGSKSIETLKIDLKSRDDIENVLRSLQHLYVNRQRDLQRIFDEEFFVDVDWNNGRPGMDCWSILVIGVLKQGTDCDFDRLRSLVNNHKLVRAMLGHEVAGKKPGAALRGRVDSFCVETDVHFPPDVNLLMDAVRCMVRETAREACRRGVPAASSRRRLRLFRLQRRPGSAR